MKSMELYRVKKQIVPFAVISFLFALIIQFSDLIPFYIMPFVIDQYIPKHDYQAVVRSVLVFCGVPLITAAINIVYKYFLMVKGKKLSAELTLKCFEKLLYQPMVFYDRSHSAEITQKCSQEATSLISIWTIDIPTIISNIVTSLGILILLYRIHPVLAYFQFFYFAFIILLTKVVGNKMQKLVEKVMVFNALFKKKMQEAFHSIRLIKSSQWEKQTISGIRKIQADIIRIWGKTAAIENLVGGLSTTFLPAIFYGGTFVLAAILVLEGKITVGLLTASIGYAGRVHGTFSSLLSTYLTREKAKGETEILREYLQMRDERDEEVRGEWRFENCIELDHVSFSYPNTDKNILKDVSMKFERGKWIAISGPSGAGKSTILELLLRFYDPTEGQILVDGQNISNITISSLRSHISYVTQEPFIIEGTIKDNLAMAGTGVSTEEMRKVAELTGLFEIFGINALDRETGEGGMLLSGGQRQRVAIAQAILRGKTVFLLDEATSQLDEESQQDVMQILYSLCKKEHCTVISVAHRESFCALADIRHRLDSLIA